MSAAWPLLALSVGLAGFAAWIDNTGRSSRRWTYLVGGLSLVFWVFLIASFL